MITPEYLDSLTARLETHGFSAALAVEIAIKVGDTPAMVDGQVVAVVDGVERRFPAALLED